MHYNLHFYKQVSFSLLFDYIFPQIHTLYIFILLFRSFKVNFRLKELFRDKWYRKNTHVLIGTLTWKEQPGLLYELYSSASLAKLHSWNATSH